MAIRQHLRSVQLRLAELASFGLAFVFLSVTALASGVIIAFFVSETLGKDAEARTPSRAEGQYMRRDQIANRQTRLPRP